MNLLISTIIAALLLCTTQQNELDTATIRLNTLRNRTAHAPDRILNFTIADFKQFAMQYPRPYTLVIYFYAKLAPLSQQLYSEYNYTVQLYSMQGAIDSQTNPTFFVRIDFTRQTSPIFKYFSFETAPNLVVSKPHMAVVSTLQRQSYLKDYKWRISQTDGVVTTQKMLDFINKRTNKNVIYKPTQQTIKYVLLVFTAVCVAGVVIYKLLKFIWSHWLFWFIASIIVYMVCMSGIVYCVLNEAITHDLKSTGPIKFFQGRGGRDQGFYEGCLVSAIISLTGIILIFVAVSSQKLKERYSAIIGILGILVVYYLMNYIETVYGVKSWYGPSYQPPGHYLKGPLNIDQGNNI